MSFNQLPLHPQILEALEMCNYTDPTPVQAKAIPEILAGKDIVACAQTGSGKTAAFVLPALHHLANKEPSGKPCVLILTPTRELATQITTAARKYGTKLRFNIVSLVGGMSYDPQIRDLKSGADIIVATPGRLIDHLENNRVDLSGVDMLVLDEADRMVDMGFIEDVENISSETPSERQTLFFSATLDKSISRVVKRLLKNPVNIDLSNEKISTPKITQTLYKAKNMHHKSRMLKHFLNDENIYKAIIFSATKVNADRLATELRDDGFAAAPLHGDLRQNVRNRTIEALRRGKIQFLVATDVAARGLDINDISHVINYDLPKFSEDYVHRIGRTGRAGREGAAISFFTNSDMRTLQSIERYIGKRLTIQSDNFVYAETSTNSRSDADKFSPNAMLENNNRGGHGGSRNRGRPQGSGNRRFNNDSFKSYDDKPRGAFSRDESRSERPNGEKRSYSDKPSFADKPRRSFNRDESRSVRPEGDRPDFGNKPSYSDKPRRSFSRDDSRSDRPAGERRSFDNRNDSSDKPRRSFNRDEPRSGKPFGEKRSFGNRSDSSDKARRSFDRDDSRAGKPFGEKRSFGNRSDSSDKPRRSFNRDEPRSGKPFGEKRSFGNRSDSSDKPRRSFNRDEPRSDRPYGERRFDNDSRRNTPHANAAAFTPKARGQHQDSGRSSVFERPVYEFEKRDENPRVLYKKRVDTDKPGRPKFARDDASKKPRDGSRKPAARSAVASKPSKKPYREAK